MLSASQRSITILFHVINTVTVTHKWGSNIAFNCVLADFDPSSAKRRMKFPFLKETIITSPALAVTYEQEFWHEVYKQIYPYEESKQILQGKPMRKRDKTAVKLSVLNNNLCQSSWSFSDSTTSLNICCSLLLFSLFLKEKFQSFLDMGQKNSATKRK